MSVEDEGLQGKAVMTYVTSSWGTELEILQTWPDCVLWWKQMEKEQADREEWTGQQSWPLN